jgi:hypothetical protein
VKKKLEYSVLLDDDVRDAFPDDESVNEALKVILTAAQKLAARLAIRTKKKRPKATLRKENELSCSRDVGKKDPVQNTYPSVSP